MWGFGREAVGVRRAGMDCSLGPYLVVAYPFKKVGRFWGRGSFLSLVPQVLIPVACVWIVSALLGLSIIPGELSAPTKAPWFWLPHPGRLSPRRQSLHSGSL